MCTNKREGKLEELRTELTLIETRRKKLLAEIAQLESDQYIYSLPIEKSVHISEPTANKEDIQINDQSSPEEKIKLFRSLFRGRQDVYPRRFENQKSGRSGYSPVCENEWRNGICDKPRVKCAACKYRQYLPVSDQVIEWHLRGKKLRESKDFIIGVYPMMQDETCFFLAADFDKLTWEEDISAYRETCIEMKVPVAIERSRSGNGAHAWIFFSDPVPCITARKLGSYLLTETMERRPEIGLDSYDRLFPNQDTLPKGGLGNLIALPLQKKPRSNSNSLFIDENLIHYTDQWAYLSSIRKMSRNDVEKMVHNAAECDRITGVRMPVTDENEENPWESPPSHKQKLTITGTLPKQVEIVLCNQLFIPKDDLTPTLRNALVRLAAFQNPKFYHNQAFRIPVWNIPRIISCAENFPRHIALPRGCLDDVVQLFDELDVKVEIKDERYGGTPLDLDFIGHLSLEQQDSAKAMLAYNTGILAGTTAFGKTVVATYLISKRKVNTLVLVHRRQLLEQWVARLSEFLNIDKNDIGQIGGGKRNSTGKIDVAIIHNLQKKGEVDDIVAEYGQLIIDECHHISAPSFEAISREFKGKYVTGLSATITRKDGHHPIIYMNCGPVRYKVNAKAKAKERPFEHHLVIRKTLFRLPLEQSINTKLTFQEICSALMNDEARNAMIIEDVLDCLKSGRFPVLLTERREHLEYLRGQLESQIKYLIVFKGGMGKKQLAAAYEKLTTVPDGTPRLIISTGKYLGEGFDDPRLDTLFLAMPVSWKGTLAQYAGRLHRLHDQKNEVVIYDYADLNVPMLARMFTRRLKGYRGIGYEEAKYEKNL